MNEQFQTNDSKVASLKKGAPTGKNVVKVEEVVDFRPRTV